MSHMLVLQKLGRDIYEAETVCDVGRALLQTVPRWMPWVGASAFIATYIVTLRVRLCIARWRRAARRRAERRYMALGCLHDCTPPPGKCFALVGDDDDDNGNGEGGENDENNGDKTAITVSDIEEFRCSLGIRSPRDDDLLVIVEEMLLVDTIPDGWVLYRTSAGLVRFMNLNTQELFFFHPGKREEERYIRAELKRRNKVTMETKYNFFNPDESSRGVSGTVSFELWKQRRGKCFGIGNTINDDMPINRAALCFSDDDDDADGRDEQSTFRRLFHYFVDREQRSIERDVEKKFSITTAPGGPTIETPRAESRSLRVLPANVVHNSPNGRRINS